MSVGSGEHRGISAVGVARHLGRRPWVRAAARRVGHALTPVDHGIGRVSRGRVSVLELTGMPLLRLRVPRRRGGDVDGLVLGARFGEQWLIAGGDDGRPVDHRPVRPAWVTALHGSRGATLTVRGEQVDVAVHRADAEERDRWWPVLVRAWPGYADADLAAAEPWDVWLLTPR